MEKEIAIVRRAMHEAFNSRREQLIYDPQRFRQFCIQNGATTVFYSILSAMYDRRHSQNRIESNGIRALEIIYKLCYGKSQKCNFLQKQHGIYLRMNHISQEGLDTEGRIGNTVSSKTVSNEIARFAKIIY